MNASISEYQSAIKELDYEQAGIKLSDALKISEDEMSIRIREAKNMHNELWNKTAISLGYDSYIDMPANLSYSNGECIRVRNIWGYLLARAKRQEDNHKIEDYLKYQHLY